MARALWTGSIGFGLVNVPIRITTAVRDKGIHFHMLSPDGHCRLRRKLYCPETGKEYDFNDTARGYEVAPGQYVLITDEELQSLKPEAGRMIELEQFVELEEVDPLYFDSGYLLTPDEGGAAGYRLLVQVMHDSGRIGLARFVMRQKQHLAAIRSIALGGDEPNALLLHTMHYPDEVTALAEAPPEELPKTGAASAKQVKMAKQLIDSMAEPFDPSAFKDDYRERVAELIEAKAEGEDVQEVFGEEEEPPKTYSLMEALKQSIEQRKSKTTRRRKTA